MITVEELHKSYAKQVALAGVSFEVDKATIFGLLGPNGAGKTTTINILCGLLKPDSGSVSLNGKSDPTRMDVRAKLAAVPQSLAIYEELSARANLRFFGRIYGLTYKQLHQRVEYCLNLAGLQKRDKQPAAKFSGGMKRRLNLACSLVNDPDIILLDEPTAGVDAQSRNSIFDTIDSFKTAGKTIVYTTHYMEEAQRICDKVAILDYGKILAIGSVGDLITAHGGPSHIEAEFQQPVEDIENISGYIEGQKAQLNDNILRFETTNPMESLARLNQSGRRFNSLTVDTANLEDVFLNLTGRSLRDQ